MVKKRKTQKIWVVDYFEVRRHSRVLYLPLSGTVTKLHGIEKGDTIKAMLVEIIKGPPDE